MNTVNESDGGLESMQKERILVCYPKEGILKIHLIQAIDQIIKNVYYLSYMQRNAITLASISIAAAFPLIAYAAFSDVSDMDVNAEAITYVQSQGIVNGYPDGTFKADRNINRAEFTKIVIEATNNNITGSNCFPDVTEQWFAKYICTAKTLGAIGGYPDGTFRPEQEVSFVEAAKIIAAAFDTELNIDTDVWYEGYVRSLDSLNAIPTSIHSFGTQITRGEMAEMIFRLHAKQNTKASMTYEGLAGLPYKAKQNTTTKGLSTGYPYTFPITSNWQDKWNFYIDEDPVHTDPEEGVNLLEELDLERVERINKTEGKFPEFLRIHFPKGAGSFFIAHFYGKERAGVVAKALGAMKPTEEVHLRYYVRFPKNFDFSVPGTLPGIGGATLTSEYGAYGSMFNAGVYWTKKGELGVSGNFQEDLGGSRTTETSFSADNEWHVIDISARLNTVPVRRFNGEIIVKYDGKVAFNNGNGGVSFRSRDEDVWDCVNFYATIGTYDTYTVAPKDMYIDLAGFTVSDKPIK